MSIDNISEKDKEALLGVVREISEEFSKMDDAREQVKEIINAAHDNFGIPKPMIRKVARLYHKRTAAAFEAEAAEIKSIYSSITSR